MLDFHEARQWLTQTYGISDSTDKDVEYNKHWAFFIKFQYYMLYVRDDQELSWFKMKYGEEVQ
jgi:hypothetical protein